MKSVSIHEAKTNLSRLISRVEGGEAIVIRRRSEPVATLIPYSPQGDPRSPGALRGQIELAPDFDETPEGFEDYLPRS